MTKRKHNSDNDIDSDNNKIPKLEITTIDKKINNINDLIELGQMYDSTKLYDFDLYQLSKIIPSLIELNNMIGMDQVKNDIVDHIIFYIQDFEPNNDMMHTIINGPPGVGKTELAKIIAKIYLGMGILKNNNFVKANRSMLIAQYLGQTAPKTQKIIDSAIGGVLFIDEVYSLGNSEKKDIYAKECIDCINENLTEKNTDFICIIAGYKEDIEQCFLSYNKGLSRRFPVQFTIESYTYQELYLIFRKKVYDLNWKLDINITDIFFRDNYNNFKNFGGDIEILFGYCKRVHSRRVFTNKNRDKIITLTDLHNGFNKYKEHKNNNIKDDDNWKNMFI
jgi:SpoVK/Ycf46/Vps4 family AAA+-type ATPase